VDTAGRSAKAEFDMEYIQGTFFISLHPARTVIHLFRRKTVNGVIPGLTRNPVLFAYAAVIFGLVDVAVLRRAIPSVSIF
jgi:hypothetical protein